MVLWCRCAMQMIFFSPASIKLETNVNSDLSRLKEYFNLNRLSINVAKCEFMFIGTCQALKQILNINVHINGDNDNDNDNDDNDNILFDHNLKIEITIYNSLENQIINTLVWRLLLRQNNVSLA